MKYIVAERYEHHLSICKSKEFTCDVCSKKFAALHYLVMHKKKFHQDKEASKKAQRRRKKDSKTQNQKQTEKNCQEKDISLLHDEYNTSSGSHVHDVKEETSSMNMPHSANIELKSEIKVEDTMLQEQVPIEDQGKA